MTEKPLGLKPLDYHADIIKKNKLPMVDLQPMRKYSKVKFEGY